ncbi:BatA domain-containing protein [Haloferula chungangensis]|uniref:BatA domain-containing protein n=1 Tax=Haloferula chungangensis TaxID=1048331 RepID=A0ABW2L7V0_9BACT
MFFLQSAMLWGLFAVSIPIIIHLLNRRRHRTVQWAAMQFLLKATRESRGKKRLRHILILTCRALGIAALIFAAAVPVVSKFFGLGSGKPDLIVLIFDRSASMEANPKNGTIPRRELSLQRLRDAFADLEGTRLVLIDSASGIPQDVPSPDVLAELSATAVTDTKADLPGLLSTAAEFLAETPGRAEIWVASDLQSTNWSANDSRWDSVRASLTSLQQQPRVRVLALGGENADNQTIQILSSRRSGTNLLLDLRIARGGDARSPLNLPVTININGARTTESVTIPGQEMRFIKTIPLPSPDDHGHGWVSIPGDGNPRDNVAFYAYGPARPVKSSVVAAGEAASYLDLAAAPDGFGGQSADTIQGAAAASLVTADQSAILWAEPLPSGPIAAELERFLSEGGQVIFFPPSADSDNSFLDISWSAVGVAERDQFFILDSWDHDDGLLRDGIDGTPVPADRLRAVKRRIPEGEASVLARWDDTQAFLVRRVVGRGTAWFIGSLPDYTWSNLGDADVLLPAVQRAVLAGAERFDSGYLATVGSSVAEVKADEIRERLDDYGSDAKAEPEYLAGIQKLGERTLAINRPASEDIPDVIERSALTGLMEGTDFSLFEDTSSSGRENVSRGIWRGFLIAMLFFLLSEALLCLPGKPVATHTSPRPPVQHAR